MSPDREEILRLRVEIRAEDPDVRSAAIERATALIDETIRGVVAEALLSENPEVRSRALGLLDLALREPTDG